MTAAPPPRIHVVDDDAHFLRSLLFMVEGLGFDAVGHPSPWPRPPPCRRAPACCSTSACRA